MRRLMAPVPALAMVTSVLAAPPRSVSNVYWRVVRLVEMRLASFWPASLLAGVGSHAGHAPPLMFRKALRYPLNHHLPNGDFRRPRTRQISRLAPRRAPR